MSGPAFSGDLLAAVCCKLDSFTYHMKIVNRENT